MRTLGRVVLFLVGLALLLPGACSLTVLPFGLWLVGALLTGPSSANGGWEALLSMVPIWVVGLLLGALGVRMLMGVLRGPREP